MSRTGIRVLTALVAGLWTFAGTAIGASTPHTPTELERPDTAATSRPAAANSPITAKRKTAAKRTMRHGKLAHLRLPSGRTMDRLVHPTDSCVQDDTLHAVVFWSGRCQYAGIRSTQAAPFALAVANKSNADAGLPDAQPGLASAAAAPPGLGPPGRDINYKLSFNVPLGKYELLAVQAGVHRDTTNTQGVNDSSVRAAWLMKF
jgi:hypothetical protein